MKRIKSAPANIAEMVNRKKPLLEKKSEKSRNIILFAQKKQKPPIVMKEKIIPLKNQKNIEKTFNNIMLDYINDKQILNNNDEEAMILSILYFYICEKIFTKNNLREFILFVVQTFIRYIITHNIHEFYTNNHEIINNKLNLIEYIK